MIIKVPKDMKLLKRFLFYFRNFEIVFINKESLIYPLTPKEGRGGGVVGSTGQLFSHNQPLQNTLFDDAFAFFKGLE